MVIRQQQRELMREARADLFAARMVQRLRRREPVRTASMPAVELRRFVDSAVAHGHQIAIYSPANLQYLVEFLFDSGLDYENHAEFDGARRILRAVRKDESSRIRLLSEHQVFCRRSIAVRPNEQVRLGVLV